MKKSSFTDEQLLNLINNTILNKTEFSIDEFTGGSVQITTTNNHQLMKHKVSLFFGYKQKNPISRTIEINENLVSIWMEAIILKCKSLQISNSGMDFSELNELMNISPNKVDSNIVVSISKGITTNLTTGSKESKIIDNETENSKNLDKFSFNLKTAISFDKLTEEYKLKLKEYIEKHNEELFLKRLNDGSKLKEYYTYEDMENDFLASGKAQKNFQATFNKYKYYTYEREIKRRGLNNG